MISETEFCRKISDFEPEFDEFVDIGVAESAYICGWIGWRR